MDTEEAGIDLSKVYHLQTTTALSCRVLFTSPS